MRTLLFSTLLLATGCAEKTASGTLTDGLTGKPIAEMRLIATAQDGTATSCSVLEARTDAAGAFTFKGLCADVSYQVKPENENVWLADGDTLKADATASFKGYRAPDGRGMYRLIGDELAIVKTNADIQTESILNNDTETVTYPSVIPTKPVAIPADGYLVLVGQETADSMQFVPLIASTDRQFGSTKSTLVKMKPWSYIGVEFKSDTEFERKSASLDEGKVVARTVGDRHASWIRGDALPAGRYVVHKEGSTRTTILEFGKPAE
ncbi:MAG: hypothetical protein KC656_08470 [Myxococcales bacterium]|nr:hypothetical protein [Myxococcales bacterium]MCB9670223.1 hypothetical protein [Alphaproteobacteria bacterium]MCB9694684.1 hypothetical protein [Alphaproteobacteria bacterium]